MTYYKILNHTGESPFRNERWNLPTENPDGTWTPGEWMRPVEGELALCKNGYHGCTEQDVFQWIGYNSQVFTLEYRGEVLVLPGHGKVAGREARLLKRVLSYWDIAALSCDFALHVLPLFESKRPDDHRPRQHIEAYRRHALSNPDEYSESEELMALQHEAIQATRDLSSQGHHPYTSVYFAALTSVTCYAFLDTIEHATSAVNCNVRETTPKVRGSIRDSIVELSAAEKAERNWQEAHLLKVLHDNS